MSFVAECPSCGQKLKVPDNLTGKKVRCSKCQGTFTAEGTNAAPPPPEASRQRESVRERPDRDDNIDFGAEQEERPARRSSRRTSRRADEFDDGGDDHHAPGRGGMILTFGIVSIAMAVMSLVSTFLCNMFLPIVGTIGGILFVILGIVFGLMAWMMGSGDLKKIRSGQISRAAEGSTKGGHITGIIGTILNILQIVCACVMMIVGAIIAGGLIAAAKQKQNQNPNGPVFPPPPARRGQMLPPAKLLSYLPTRTAGW